MSQTATVSPDLVLDLQRHTLDNGLRVVLHRDPALPLVTVNLWYHVGSKNERPGRTGLAHLFEHMLFQGSAHVGVNDHFRLVQQAGGVTNGSTWYDRTNYFETLPASHLELGLWLESDRMGYLLPALTQEKLDTQRDVVMNERRQRVDNQPYGLAFERLHELLFPAAHPYHWPVIGYMDDIAAADLDDMSGFFRTYYAPDNAVLTLAGDFEPDRALAQVERWFGDIAAGPGTPPVTSDLAPLSGERRTVLEDDVRLPRLYLGYRLPRYGEPEWYAADLLGTVLAGGKSSPLYEDLVYERQMAQDVSCWVFATELDATFFVIATAKPETAPDELLAALDEHLARAGSRPLPDDAIEGARNQLLTQFFEGVQKLDGRADFLSQLTTYFDAPERIADEPARYRKVTAGELQALAADRLRPDQRAMVTVVPAGGGSGNGDAANNDGARGTDGR